MNPAGRHTQPHLIVVEAYQGYLEHLDDGDERSGSQGLGLPLSAIAEALDCRITLLDWSDWQNYEQDHGSFVRWFPFPATRPLDIQEPPAMVALGDRLTQRAIPARDPGHGRPFATGLSPKTFGLLADSDPLFLASYVLNQFLEELWCEDPYDLVIVPMFGGLGFVPQLSRATGSGLMGVRFATVVTGTSAERQLANGEGLWTRPAISRRQMEDMSLGLADLAITFGPCGRRAAEAGRQHGVIVEAPRRVPDELIARIRIAATADTAERPINFYIHEPLQGASGALLALDAAKVLLHQGSNLQRPIRCSGANMRFPPSLPKDFQSYWSSRGWAKSLVEQQYWQWCEGPPAAEDVRPIRLYPSSFEHLPDIWRTLACGHAVLLSRNAAEGLAPIETLPSELVLGEDPSAEDLAARLVELDAAGSVRVQQLHQRMCEAVLASCTGPIFDRRFSQLTEALRDLLAGRIAAPRLDQAARRLLDGRPGATAPSLQPTPAVPIGPATLTVAIPCFEMGRLVIETVESVWASTRLPDEVLIVDDGSRGDETKQALTELQATAGARSLPLSIIRQGNQGLAAARNTALAAARSTYISFLDGDDLIGAEFYELGIEILAKNPGLGGVAAWAETFGQGVHAGFWNAPQPELPLLLAENTVFVPCMSPVGLLRRLGGYDVRQRYNYEDWELAIRIVASGYPIITIPRYLQRYRVRADSLLRTMSDVQNQVMREELFRNHRATVETFGPELAAQIEHRMMRTLERRADPELISGKAALEALRSHATLGVRRAVGRAAWQVRSVLGAKRSGR